MELQHLYRSPGLPDGQRRTLLDTARQNRDLLWGLAHFTAQAGNREQALDYVRQLRELDPEDPQYERMAQQIGGGR